MNKTKLQNRMISVGIPTYEASDSLVMTVDSIINQSYFDNVKQILIVVDGKTIKKEVLSKLTNKKIRIVYFKVRKGQSTRINDIFHLLNTDQIILTNDDVLFDSKVVENVLNHYSQVGLVASNVRTMKKDRYFEKTLDVGQLIRLYMAKNWNGGDNYLSCNGRLIVLSKSLYKNLSIPEKIWNNDAYMYIQSKILKYSFKFAPDIIVHYKSPNTLKEHMSQSTKFQKSLVDLQRYFTDDISSYYLIPVSIKLISLFKVMFKSPVLSIAYLFLFIETRMRSFFSRPEFAKQGFWKTDLSTKRL